MVSLALILVACLEHTGEGSKALDPRFVVLPEGVGAIDAEGNSQPFADYDGATVVVSGVVESALDMALDLDFRQVQETDAGAERVNLGKLGVTSPGEWSLEVPAGLGNLIIEGFQDLSSDGPTEDDPYGWLELEVGLEDVDGADLVLEVGGLLAARAAMGMGGEGGAFADYTGEWVSLAGTFVTESSLPVQADLRSVEENTILGKWTFDSKDWSIDVPLGLGSLQLQVFQDVDENGPSDTDPFGFANLQVDAESQLDLVLELVVGGKMALAEAMGHSEGDGPGGGAQPFSDHEGLWTLVTGEITGPSPGAVQVDFRVSDPSAEGGNRHLGVVQLEALGAYELRLPRDGGLFLLELFQDVGGDGPDALDPFAGVSIEIGDEAAQSLDVELVVGSRGQPGAPGGGGQSGATTEGSLFDDSELEDPVTLSGQVLVDEGIEGVSIVDLDVFAVDPEAPGGRRFLGKLKVGPGPFSIQVPANYGSLEFDAFGDKDGDGPTPGDPFGRCRCNPLEVGGDDISGLRIRIEEGGS